MAKEDVIVVSRRELKRLGVIKKVLEGWLKQVKAAELLGLSIRQIGRIVKRVKVQGEGGIIHGLRGKESNRRISEELREKVLGQYGKKYKGFGPTLAVEKLGELDKIHLSKETLRQWLLEARMWERQRKGRKYREWRERKGYFGEMTQMDGSHHDWFEGRGPKCVLMGYIDDATNNVYARFYDYEGTLPAMDSFKRYVRKHGIPGSVYLDKHTTYKSTGELSIEDELEGKERPMSEFERALKELEVTVIHANSPQAKGRIERLFRTFQDRLIKEMRLAGVKNQKEGNDFLENYLPKYNERFKVEARQRGDLHRRIGKLDLDRILCIKTARVLRNDFTVAHDSKFYQVTEHTKAKQVMVEERVDGTMRIYNKEKNLKFKEIESRPERKKKLKLSDLPFRLRVKKKYILPADHPWRKFKLNSYMNAVRQGALRVNNQVGVGR